MIYSQRKGNLRHLSHKLMDIRKNNVDDKVDCQPKNHVIRATSQILMKYEKKIVYIYLGKSEKMEKHPASQSFVLHDLEFYTNFFSRLKNMGGDRGNSRFFSKSLKNF